ncbi:hypothetical protein PP707_05435 [Acetobacter pasteurianus]|nr:hypothetical protein [Acetobacter pasteurianus]
MTFFLQPKENIKTPNNYWSKQQIVDDKVETQASSNDDRSKAKSRFQLWYRS